jgi:hypothetical protein
MKKIFCLVFISVFSSQGYANDRLQKCEATLKVRIDSVNPYSVAAQAVTLNITGFDNEYIAIDMSGLTHLESKNVLDSGDWYYCIFSTLTEALVDLGKRSSGIDGNRKNVFEKYMEEKNSQGEVFTFVTTDYNKDGFGNWVECSNK